MDSSIDAAATTRTRQPAASSREAVVSPVTPAPNTVTRMATMVLQRREAACRIGWCLVAPDRDVEGSPESERTGIVRLATKYFNTVFSRMAPRPLRGIGPANSVVELEVLGPVMRSRPRTGSGYTYHTAGLERGTAASSSNETGTTSRPLDGRIYLHMSAICWLAA